MGLPHPSTPAQRSQWASHLLAHAGEYGVVAALSRATGVSRPTLYAWRAHAQHALLQAFTPPPVAPVITPAVEREVLTLWVEAHASTRAIQTCLATLTQPECVKPRETDWVEIEGASQSFDASRNLPPPA